MPYLFRLANDRGGNWCPDWLGKLSEVGLNLQLPIYRGDNNHYARFMGFDETRFSSDLEIRALYSNIWALRMAAFQAAGVAALHEQGGYEKIALGKQNHAPLRDVAWRFPDPSLGDLAEVQTVCSRCRSFLLLDRFPRVLDYLMGHPPLMGHIQKPQQSLIAVRKNAFSQQPN